jgi:hypothetical protein
MLSVVLVMLQVPQEGRRSRRMQANLKVGWHHSAVPLRAVLQLRAWWTRLGVWVVRVAGFWALTGCGGRVALVVRMEP